MPTLYVVETGAQIEKEYHRLLVTKEDEVLLRVPLQQVTHVVIVGMAGVTTPALHALLEQGVPLLFVKRGGELAGKLLPPTSPNIPLRQAQHRRDGEEAFRRRTASAIVSAKLHNQRVLALRILRRGVPAPAGALDDLRAAERSVEPEMALESLLGVEGSGARAYFSIYRQAFDPSWCFEDRNRRPPRDPVNGLLSLGYSFLTHALMTALEIIGLDPYLGIFHTEKYGRPALALDLVEEFRAPVVDSLTMGLINRRLLQEDDFEPDPASPAGIRLTDKGLRVFVREFSDRLESEIHIRGVKKPLTYRKVFEIQARRLARAISGEEKVYRPFLAR